MQKSHLGDHLGALSFGPQHKNEVSGVFDTLSHTHTQNKLIFLFKIWIALGFLFPKHLPVQQRYYQVFVQIKLNFEII